MESTASDLRETVCSLFSQTLGFDLSDDAGSRKPAWLYGCVHIIGAENLVLMIGVNDALARRSARAFLESNEDVGDGELPEVFGELVNIVAGNLTGMMGEAHFTLPIVSRAPMQVPNVEASHREHFRDDSAGTLDVELYAGVPFASHEEVPEDLSQPL